MMVDIWNYANTERFAAFMCTLQVELDYLCLFLVNDWPGQADEWSSLHSLHISHFSVSFCQIKLVEHCVTCADMWKISCL